MGDAAEKQEELSPLTADNDGKAVLAGAPEFMTIEETADLLRVNRKTLAELIESEAPTWAKRIGRIVRVSRSALLKSFETESPAGKKRRA